MSKWHCFPKDSHQIKQRPRTEIQVQELTDFVDCIILLAEEIGHQDLEESQESEMYCVKELLIIYIE